MSTIPLPPLPRCIYLSIPVLDTHLHLPKLNLNTKQPCTYTSTTIGGNGVNAWRVAIGLKGTGWLIGVIGMDNDGTKVERMLRDLSQPTGSALSPSNLLSSSYNGGRCVGCTVYKREEGGTVGATVIVETEREERTIISHPRVEDRVKGLNRDDVVKWLEGFEGVTENDVGRKGGEKLVYSDGRYLEGTVAMMTLLPDDYGLFLDLEYKSTSPSTHNLFSTTIIQKARYCKVDRAYVSELYGRDAVAMLGCMKGARGVVVTDGKREAWGYQLLKGNEGKGEGNETKARRYRVKRYKPCLLENVRNTTGAGDSFCGGLMTGLVDGLCWEDAVKGAVRVAGVWVETGKVGRGEDKAVEVMEEGVLDVPGC